MLFKIFKKRTARVAGFTLIEIMIVVFIIALLSTAAVGGYTRYRKISLLELAVDNIVSTVYQARDSARSGAGGADPLSLSSSCYGILFEKNAGTPVRKVSADFKKQKSWDASLERWGEGSCDTSGTVAGSGEPIDLDDLVVIDMDQNTCWVLFAPPNGEISSTCTGTGEELSILINYGEEADESYQRIIKFDLKSGIANVENP